MSEYIERGALLENGFYHEIDNTVYWEERDIMAIPAADVVEVKHGRWIHDTNNLYGCSECMERETMSHKKLKPYCPNCGAKMDGDK